MRRKKNVLHNSISFREYIWGNKMNKAYLLLAIIGIAFQWIVFKIMYPYASFISGDSYAYLEAAYWNLPINTYPVGYSRFLRIFSAFTTSDTALVTFQYLLLQCSNLFFLFTLWYFYQPGKVVKNMLYVFLVINPVFLYMGNYVSSDPLFLALSVLWFTLLLWIIHQPTVQTVALQCLVLFLAFTVRYNALIYPFIAGLALILTRQRLGLKLAGIAGSLLLIAGFVWHTSNQYEQITGKRQFSPFSGWQIANNALYAYKFVDSAHVKPVPAKFQKLDRMVRSYFDTTRDFKRHPEEALIASTAYMWDSISPLRRYMEQETAKDTTVGPITRWATVAPELAAYGAYLIRHYPLEFAKYYLFPNMLKYYMPPVEFLAVYNMGKDSVAPIAQAWFGYKTLEVKSRFKTKEVNILNWYPNLVLMINMGFLFGCIGFLGFKGWSKTDGRLKRTVLFITTIWIINFCFSVFASPIALRFQMFPIMVLFAFTTILAEFIYKIDSYEKQEIPTAAIA